MEPNSTPLPGYHNNEAATARRPISLKKILLIIVIVVLSISLVYFARHFLAIANDSNLGDDEEALIEYVDSDSPIAGIQLLTSYGLNYEEYMLVHDLLADYFKKKHPDYTYVEYVYDSVDLTRETDYADSCETDIDQGDASLSCDNIDVFAPYLLKFDLQANNNDMYSVVINLDELPSSSAIGLYDVENHKLL